MSRVASESRVSIAAQIEASRPRAGGSVRNDATQPFDELLPQPEPTPPPEIQKSQQQVTPAASDVVTPDPIGSTEELQTREALQNEIRPADNKPTVETKSTPPEEKTDSAKSDTAKSDAAKPDAPRSETAHVDSATSPVTPAAAQPAVGPTAAVVAAAIPTDVHSVPEAGGAAATPAAAGIAAIEAGKSAAKAEPKTEPKTEIKTEGKTATTTEAKTAPKADPKAATKSDVTPSPDSAAKATASKTASTTAADPKTAATTAPTTDPAVDNEAAPKADGDAAPARVATAAPVTIMAATMQPLKTIGATIALQNQSVGTKPAAAKAAAADAKAQAKADAAPASQPTTDATATAGKPATAVQPHTADAGAPASRPVDGTVAQPQNVAATLPQGQTPATNPPNLAQAAVQVPVPLAGLALEISARAQAGSNRFEIRLDPPELGRIDVSLHVDAHGQVTSHLIVDRADTLNLLQRDSSDLERSLQQAGLKTGDNGLQFSLRDQSFGAAPDNSGRPTARVIVPEIEAAPAAEIMARSYTRAGQGTGLDIRV